jgi:hypothetical protein
MGLSSQAEGSAKEEPCAIFVGESRKRVRVGDVQSRAQ